MPDTTGFSILPRSYWDVGPFGIGIAHVPQVTRTLHFQGCRLTYRVDGAGSPLVMIQGVGAQGLARNPQIEILKRHYACLSFDNRGIGLSQPAGKRLTVEQMAVDAAALMDDAGWDSAHIVGHSMGGLIALQLALTARERARSLGLLCAFPRGAAAMTPRVLWKGFQMRFAPRYFRRRAFLQLVLPPQSSYSDEMADRMSGIVGHDIGDPPPITSQQLSAMRECDLTQRLDALSGISTLVVSAEKDLVARPPLGRAIAAAIRGSHYVEILGASHAFPILEPERCSALLLEHFAKTERTAAGRCSTIKVL